MNRLLMIALLLASGAPATAAIDRTSYVTEASRELEGYLAHLSSDSVFVAQLQDAERAQLSGILAVLRSLPGGPKLAFSNRREDFILSPGEPERSAKTTEVLNDPIYVNLRKLNLEGADIDLLQVVRLVIHEVGHKLGRNEIQTAVDSLAAKATERLKAFYKSENVRLILSMERRRMEERFEFISIPKAIGSANPDPSLFYVDKEGPRKIRLHFRESLASLASDRLVSLDRVQGFFVNPGSVNADVRFSVAKPFKAGEAKVSAREMSYLISEVIVFMDGRALIDTNFRLSQLQLSYGAAGLGVSVTDVREIERTATSITWEVAYQNDGQGVDEVALIEGTDDNSFLIPCSSPLRNGSESRVKCRLDVPSKSSAPTLDVKQLLVNGSVADLPDLVQVDLEMDFKVDFALSDCRFSPIKSSATAVGKTVYQLEIECAFPVRELRIRCVTPKDFVYKGLKLGTIDAFDEQIFVGDRLPLRQTTKGHAVAQFACRDGGAALTEVLVSDGTLYTYSRRTQ